MSTLLAIDLGLRSGLAWLGEDGRLLRYRSVSFADSRLFKAGAASILSDDRHEVTEVVAEGDPRLARVWSRELARRGIALELIAAEAWRPSLLLPRERRDKHAAKAAADRFARQMIDWSGCARPTSLTHDVAEAICIATWGALQRGWLDGVPFR